MIRLARVIEGTRESSARGHRRRKPRVVLLVSDIATLYGVATKALLQAPKLERFPADFMLRVTFEEWAVMRSQNVTSKPQRGG
jgi:hypothetical protein